MKRAITLVFASAIPLAACDSKQADDAARHRLELAVYDAMCAPNQQDRALALGRVVERAGNVPSETRDSEVVDTASELQDCANRPGE